jgi:hypothetical protein
LRYDRAAEEILRTSTRCGLNMLTMHLVIFSPLKPCIQNQFCNTNIPVSSFTWQILGKLSGMWSNAR